MHRTRACPSSANHRGASRVDPTCVSSPGKTGRLAMSDIAQLEQQILADVSGAGDEASLEAVRVATLGKSGSVSALLKTLGTMTPDERRQQGPLINGLKDRVTAAIATRRDALKIG